MSKSLIPKNGHGQRRLSDEPEAVAGYAHAFWAMGKNRPKRRLANALLVFSANGRRWAFGFGPSDKIACPTARRLSMRRLCGLPYGMKSEPNGTRVPALPDRLVERYGALAPFLPTRLVHCLSDHVERP